MGLQHQNSCAGELCPSTPDASRRSATSWWSWALPSTAGRTAIGFPGTIGVTKLNYPQIVGTVRCVTEILGITHRYCWHDGILALIQKFLAWLQRNGRFIAMRLPHYKNLTHPSHGIASQQCEFSCYTLYIMQPSWSR